MRRTTRSVLCILGGLATIRAVPLRAQTVSSISPAFQTSTPASQYLDVVSGIGLEQLVQRALARNADLLATRERTAEAQGLLRQAGFRPNPVVETEFSSGSATGSSGERSFSLGYAHTFEMGGKRTRRVELGRTGVDLARLDITDAERNLRADLQGRYIAAMAAIRNLDTITQQLDVTRQNYVVTQRRVAEGESPRVEEVVLQAETGRLTAERLLLEGEAQQTMIDLRVAAAMDVTEPLRLRPDGDRSGFAMTLESALERGLSMRPDLAAARSEEVRSAGEVRLAEAEKVPDVAALVRYTDTQSRFDLFGFTATGAVAPIRDRDRILTGGLSIALPVFARNQGQLEAARARQRAASLRREYAERAVRAEIAGAYQRYLASMQAAQTFETSVIQPSDESVRVLRASYAAGEIRLFDLLTEQRRVIDSQKAYTDAIRQEALARVALERAIGTPLP